MNPTTKVWQTKEGPSYGLLVTLAPSPSDKAVLIESTLRTADILSQVWEISLLMAAIQNLFIEADKQVKGLDAFLYTNGLKALNGATSRILRNRDYRRENSLQMLPFDEATDYLYLRNLVQGTDLKAQFMAIAFESIKKPKLDGSVSVRLFSKSIVDLIPAQPKDWS